MNDLIHTAGEGVDSTIIQCVHEQSLTGICIFPVLFASNGSPMYKSLTNHLATLDSTFFLKLMPENQGHSGRLTAYVQTP